MTAEPGDPAATERYVAWAAEPARPATALTALDEIEWDPAPSWRTVAATLRLVQGDVEHSTTLRATLERSADGEWRALDLSHDGAPVAVPEAQSASALACLGLPTLLVELSGLDAPRPASAHAERPLRFAVGETPVVGQQALRWEGAACRVKTRARGQLPGSPFGLELRARARWEVSRDEDLPRRLELHATWLASGGPGEDARSEVHLELTSELGATQ